MTSLLSRYATPLITGLFLVSLISGVALFFHWGAAWFHGMHEWLSMVLIVPFVLHLWKNWRPMRAYLRHAPMAIALALSVVAAAAFVVPGLGGNAAGGGGGRPPQFAVAQRVLEGRLADVAPVFGLSAEALASRLTASGLRVGAPDQTLAQIAAASGRDGTAVLAVLAGRQQDGP